MIVATLNFPSVFICCLFLLLSCASLLILNAKVIERRTTLWQGELKGGERWRGCGRGSGPGKKKQLVYFRILGHEFAVKFRVDDLTRLCISFSCSP